MAKVKGTAIDADQQLLVAQPIYIITDATTLTTAKSQNTNTGYPQRDALTNAVG